MTEEQFHQLIARLEIIEHRIETIEEQMNSRPMPATTYTLDQLKSAYSEFEFMDREDENLIDVYYRGQIVHQLRKEDL